MRQQKKDIGSDIIHTNIEIKNFYKRSKSKIVRRHDATKKIFLFMFEKNMKKIWTFLKKEKIQIKLNTKCGGLYDTTVWIGIIKEYRVDANSVTKVS